MLTTKETWGFVFICLGVSAGMLAGLGLIFAYGAVAFGSTVMALVLLGLWGLHMLIQEDVKSWHECVAMINAHWERRLKK